MNLSLPRGLADRSTELLIDGEIRKLLNPATGRNARMSADWNKNVDPLWFGRLALRVGVSQAHDASEEREKPKFKDEWDTTGRKIESARSRLYGALSHMAGSHFEIHRVHTLRHVLRQMTKPMIWGVDAKGKSTRANGANLTDRQAWADEAANELLRALNILERLGAAAQTLRSEVAQTTVNPGELEKNAFVLTMAEAWTFFTGRFPGVASERNPFIAFAEAAWTDAGGPRDETFIRATKNAVGHLKRDVVASRSFRPGWADSPWIE